MFKQFRLEKRKIGYNETRMYKGVQKMRPKRMSFEQLVSQNIREMLEDENSIDQLEIRLEKRHEANARKKREQDANLFSNE